MSLVELLSFFEGQEFCTASGSRPRTSTKRVEGFKGNGKYLIRTRSCKALTIPHHRSFLEKGLPRRTLGLLSRGISHASPRPYTHTPHTHTHTRTHTATATTTPGRKELTRPQAVPVRTRLVHRPSNRRWAKQQQRQQQRRRRRQHTHREQLRYEHVKRRLIEKGGLHVELWPFQIFDVS